MSNKTKKKLKNLPYDSMKEVDQVSDQLYEKAFKRVQLAMHMRTLLRDERFSGLMDRYHKPWPFALNENGKGQAFITAELDPETEVVKTSVNRAFLDQMENKDLLVPLVRSAVCSIDESYKNLLGLGLDETAVKDIMRLLGGTGPADG